MASLEGSIGGDVFPAVNATRELNLGIPEEFPVDPISSDVATAKQLKEEAEARARAKAAAIAEEARKCKCSLGGTLMSTLTVTAVVATAVVVAFMVTKKLKQT